MGLPTEFKEFQIPDYVIKTLYIIGFFRDMLDALCPYIGLPSFLDPETSRPNFTRPHYLSTSTDEFVPVIRFSDLLTHPEDCCTVCLSEFESDDKIRQLPNCRHVFHHPCLDRWIVDCRNMTCPICRDRFLPVENYAPVSSDSGSGSVWFVDELESAL